MRIRERLARAPTWTAHVAGVTITGCVWAFSDGAILYDEIAHFLIAKHSWQQPELLLDLWGRAGHTLLYVLPAQGGLPLARAFSLLLALLTAFATVQIGRELQVRPLAMVAVLLWFQPWYSEMSFTVVTEVPFSMLLASGSYAYLRRRHVYALLAFGCLPLVRHEGILITLISSAGAVATRRWTAAVAAWLPWLAYNVCHYAVVGDWPFALLLDPQADPSSDRGGWLHFAPRVVANAGIPVVLLALAGTRRMLATRASFLWPYVIYGVTHVVLFRFGLFKTGGYSIFLLPLAPALAIMASMGLHELRDLRDRVGDGQRRWRLAVGGVVAATVAYAAVAVTPHRISDREIALRDAAAWLNAGHRDDAPVLASHVWLHYFLDREWRLPRPWAHQIELEDVSPGTFLVWDSRYASRRGAPYDALTSSPDRWEEVWASNNRAAVIFRRR